MTEAERIASQYEWGKWQNVVAEWRKSVGDINDEKYNPLVAAIREWGEAEALRRIANREADA